MVAVSEWKELLMAFLNTGGWYFEETLWLRLWWMLNIWLLVKIVLIYALCVWDDSGSLYDSSLFAPHLIRKRKKEEGTRTHIQNPSCCSPTLLQDGVLHVSSVVSVNVPISIFDFIETSFKHDSFSSPAPAEQIKDTVLNDDDIGDSCHEDFLHK